MKISILRPTAAGAVGLGVGVVLAAIFAAQPTQAAGGCVDPMPTGDCAIYRCIYNTGDRLYDWIPVGNKAAGTSCNLGGACYPPTGTCNSSGTCLGPNMCATAGVGGSQYTGNVNGDSKVDIIWPWSNNGFLALNTTVATGTAFVQGMRNPSTGLSASAIAWLTGDVDGDGKTDFFQVKATGIDVLRSKGTSLVYTGSSALGAYGTPKAWLVGDVNGDGKSDIIEPWDNASVLGINIYASNGAGFSQTFTSSNMGQGSGALAFTMGDVNGDGKSDLIQLWANTAVLGSPLGIIVYASNGTGLSQSWANGNMGQGSGALAWLTGDVNGDGRTDIIQPFNNAGRLGLIVYQSTYLTNTFGYVQSFASSNVGPTSSESAWLTGDVNGDGRIDVIEPWNSAGMLAINVYASNGAGYALSCSSAFTGRSPTALAWLTGDVDGDGNTDVIQLWNNNGVLASTVWLSDGVSCFKFGWTTSAM